MTAQELLIDAQEHERLLRELMDEHMDRHGCGVECPVAAVMFRGWIWLRLSRRSLEWLMSPGGEPGDLVATVLEMPVDRVDL